MLKVIKLNIPKAFRLSTSSLSIFLVQDSPRPPTLPRFSAAAPPPPPFTCPKTCKTCPFINPSMTVRLRNVVYDIAAFVSIITMLTVLNSIQTETIVPNSLESTKRLSLGPGHQEDDEMVLFPAES